MERLGWVRDATAADLHIGNLESLVLADREPAHLHALLGIRHGAASMRRLSGRDQQHTLEAGAVQPGAHRRTGSLVTLAGAGTGGSGAAATTSAIASIRRGRPSPVRAEAK